MTNYIPHLIADMRVGLQKNIDPWLLPDAAFQLMENCYQYRGVVYKKGGNTFLGRLGIREENHGARGAGNTIIALNLAYVPIEPGSIIVSDGTTVFTDNGLGGFTITGGTGTVNAVTNYATGAINITFTTANPGVDITSYYFLVVNANSPCMGLRSREIPNSQSIALIGFDRTSGYQFNDALGRFSHLRNYKNTTLETSWTGTDSDFFHTTNSQGAFFATNNIPGGHFYAIIGISNAANAVITIGAHNFQNGDTVYINNVIGMGTGLINNRIGTVTAIAANTIAVNIDSTLFGAYGSGGVVWSHTRSKTASGDGIRWFDGSGWVNFAPPLDASGTPNILQGAQLLFFYKGHMVALNTVEGTTYGGNSRFAQRARFSQAGIIYYEGLLPSGLVLPTAPLGSAWRDDPGHGDYLDAPTSDEIIAAEFVKDTLVVYFERSTFRFVHTGSPILPFAWQKINTEIGARSTFSPVPFDDGIQTIGTNGVYTCDSINITRIDQMIPDEPFSFANSNNGAKRVQGIRDYYNQMTYWIYPYKPGDDDIASPTIYPNRMLVYNYIDGSFAIFKTHYTALGYYQRYADATWGSMNQTWESAKLPWNSATLQAGYPFLVAGNQQGYVLKLHTIDAGAFPALNSTSLSIQNITNAAPGIVTCINHNLDMGDHVFITDTLGTAGINDTIYSVGILSADTFSLYDSSNNAVSVAGYTGGGRVTIIDDFRLRTKLFNPFVQVGQKVRLGYVDLFVENSKINLLNTEVQLNVYGTEDYNNILNSLRVSLSDPKNPLSQKFWTRAYVNTTSQSVALEFTYNNDDIFDMNTISEGFSLHGMIVWMLPAGRVQM